MREPKDPKTDFKKSGSVNGEIPRLPGAEEGLLGMNAPNSRYQTGDIEDRLRAAGKLGPLDYTKR